MAVLSIYDVTILGDLLSNFDRRVYTVESVKPDRAQSTPAASFRVQHPFHQHPNSILSYVLSSTM